MRMYCRFCFLQIFLSHNAFELQSSHILIRVNSNPFCIFSKVRQDIIVFKSSIFSSYPWRGKVITKSLWYRCPWSYLNWSSLSCKCIFVELFNVLETFSNNHFLFMSYFHFKFIHRCLAILLFRDCSPLPMSWCSFLEIVKFRSNVIDLNEVYMILFPVNLSVL